MTLEEKIDVIIKSRPSPKELKKDITNLVKEERMSAISNMTLKIGMTLLEQTIKEISK